MTRRRAKERPGERQGDDRAAEASADPTAVRAEVLVMQRSAGNRAVAELLAPAPDEERRAPAAGPARHQLMGGQVVARLAVGDRRHPAVPLAVQRKKVAHKTGKEVDAYLTGSKFFKGYVAAAVKGGTKAEGAVEIHAAADFLKEWTAYALARENPDTGKIFTKAEAAAWEPTVNAFQAPGKIHIHDERGEPGTAIHESLHLFTHSTFLPAVDFNVNEGATEVFTRKLCAEEKITRGSFYPDQRASVDKLVTKTSEAKLADAYFDGKLADLKAAVDGATAKGTYDSWLGHMKKGKYSDADKLL